MNITEALTNESINKIGKAWGFDPITICNQNYRLCIVNLASIMWNRAGRSGFIVGLILGTTLSAGKDFLKIGN